MKFLTHNPIGPVFYAVVNLNGPSNWIQIKLLTM